MSKPLQCALSRSLLTVLIRLPRGRHADVAAMCVDQRALVLDDFSTVQQVSFRYGKLRQKPRVCLTQRPRSKSICPNEVL
jgi:hypothetical protein